MDEKILKELSELKQLIIDQNLLRKEVLTVNEACIYLNIKKGNMYKLTSKKKIPHFCPKGKFLYFNRHDLDNWLQQNRRSSQDEIEKEAADYLIQNKRR